MYSYNFGGPERVAQQGSPGTVDSFRPETKGCGTKDAHTHYKPHARAIASTWLLFQALQTTEDMGQAQTNRCTRILSCNVALYIKYSRSVFP